MAFIIFSPGKNRSNTAQWAWRALAAFLFILGCALFIFTFLKGSEYGWFKANNPFTIGDKTYELDGYSIIPLAFLFGILLIEAAGIVALTHVRKWRTGRPMMVIPTASLPKEVMTTPQNGIVVAHNISKSYENTIASEPVLQNINLAIQAKESIAIVGKSGSGKSTIMHILATLDRPTSGELIIDGQLATNLSPKELDRLRNKKFGFVFQQFFVNARNTCLENVTLPLVIMGISIEERTKRGLAILEAVGLTENANQRAGDLSGGQKQRLCIARALITKPEVIFADEPTGNLDSENGRRVIELLFRLQREQGITLVIVTHDTDLAALCDRSVTIRDGKIISITQAQTT